MKNTVYIILSIFILQACSLEETPPFLENESVFSDPDNATTALNGTYEKMTNYDFMSNCYVFLLNNTSGFFVTTKKGGNKNNPFNSTQASLKPLSGDNELNRLWKAHYRTISSANDAIRGINPTEGIGLDKEQTKLNDVLGQSYFVRAWTYFNLVRLWGDVPLPLEPTTADKIHLPKTPAKDVYKQVISDAQNAAKYMNGAMGVGYPKQYAANMLLAKVYMHLATADAALQDTGANYWQLAYDEAIKVYGKYELVTDYAHLFDDIESENTKESIFEIQFSELVTSDYGRSFTPQWYLNVNTFGLQQVNPEVYDCHEAAYPGDPRIASTFLSEYTQTNNGKTITTYPTRAVRPSNWRLSFPYMFKTSLKNKALDTRNHNRNVVIYRYGDLLLMLAEISNELQNGEQLGYVTELLARPSINLSPQAKYSMGQDAFREAVMYEYTFELLGEGQDWFNNRRRGYQWFRDHVIDPHNNYSGRIDAIDVTHETDESIVMFLPMPSDEINTNEGINN